MSELIGRNLGPYRVMEQLGMGGMATVYKAYQPNMDRSVAVKVLPRHFAQDPTFVGRFEQEAKVIAKLEHARILPVYDYGEDDGITYIVMRYLDAGTLSDLIRQGRIPLAETARIIGQIAEGLDYAHKKGVIHRDVKPSNIMLDSNGDVYITDFGISKLIEGTAQFTSSGIVGTPDYVSPEQGLGQTIDYRSDIYSLGIVLYQMATNDVPFHAETPMAVIIKHIHEPLPLPRSLVPDLPDSVESVILKALAKNPEDRYQSCSELAQALGAAVAGAHIPASPARVPTASPNVTMPLAGPGDAPGTIPLPPAGRTAQQVQSAAKKKSSLGTILLVAGALVVIAVIGLVIVGALNRARDRRVQGTATAIAAAAQPTTATEQAAAPTDQPVPTQPGTTTAPDTPAGKTVGFTDEFEEAALKQPWRWFNKPPQTKWSLVGGHLEMAVLPNTTVADPKTSAGLTAPALAIPIPNGAAAVGYTAQVDVTISPSADFQSAGLVVLDDGQRPWFNLVRAQCSAAAPACSGDAVYLDDWRSALLPRVAYQARQAGGGQLPAGGPVRLRLTVQARSVSGEYSLDSGATWLKVGEWPVARGNQIGFVGVVTSSGSQNAPEIGAQFDHFSVMPLGAQ